MENLFLLFGIGGLLLATLVFNDIAATIEYKARQKKLSVYRLKRYHDELSDYIERLLPIKLPTHIQQFVFQEMLSHLEEILVIEPDYPNLDELITIVNSFIIEPDNETDLEQDSNINESTEYSSNETMDANATESEHGEDDSDVPIEREFYEVTSEKDLEHVVALIRGFTIYIREHTILSSINDNKDQLVDDIIEFKYEIINQFYSLKAMKNIKSKDYARALTFVRKLHSLFVMSGVTTPRIVELNSDAISLQIHVNGLIKEADALVEKKNAERLKKRREEEEANKI